MFVKIKVLVFDISFNFWYIEETNAEDIASIEEEKKPTDLFASDISKTTLNPDEQVRLTKLLNDYRDVFAFSQEEIGRTSVVQHHTDTGNSPPVRQRPYRTPPA